MKISEVCAKTGLTDRAIRFYIEKGLLQKTAENINGRNCREYGDEDIQQLNRISALRKAGFSIQDILEMQQGPEAVRSVMESHSKKLETEAENYISIAKELKSIHVGGGVSWQKLADVLMAEGEQYFTRAKLQWPQEVDEILETEKGSTWKRRKNWIKNGLAIGMLCLSFGMVLAGLVYTWKREIDEKKKAAYTSWSGIALSDVCFEEVWRSGNQMYASIYGDTWPYSLSENFDEPITVKLGTGVDARAIVTEEGITYVSVGLRADIPYNVAEVFDVIYVEESTGFIGLDWKKLLKHRNLVENYCTVTDASYDNNIQEKRLEE
jgi:DNA-binding transcriptional MerR regulator